MLAREFNTGPCWIFSKFKAEGTCKDLNTSMEYPESKVSYPENVALSDPDNKGDEIVQLKPQRIHLDMRKGKFN